MSKRPAQKDLTKWRGWVFFIIHDNIDKLDRVRFPDFDD